MAKEISGRVMVRYYGAPMRVLYSRESYFVKKIRSILLLIEWIPNSFFFICMPRNIDASPMCLILNRVLSCVIKLLMVEGLLLVMSVSSTYPNLLRCDENVKNHHRGPCLRPYKALRSRYT